MGCGGVDSRAIVSGRARTHGIAGARLEIQDTSFGATLTGDASARIQPFVATTPRGMIIIRPPEITAPQALARRAFPNPPRSDVAEPKKRVPPLLQQGHSCFSLQ